MARVALHGGQGKMRLHTAHSDDEECVQSGSATGFSDAEREEYPLPRPVNKQARHAFDPVTQILDKIDAELVSLTRSQGSSSTATTATDSTIVRRPGSRNGGSSLENGDELSISQLGSSSYKPSVSLQSSSNLTGSDRDTGIGSATNSYHDNSHLTNDSNCREPDVRPLEPGDTFKTHKGHRGNSHGAGHRQRSATAPEMVYLNGQHLSDDDKTKRGQEGTLTLETKRGQESTSSLEAKQVDEKFREIMQKRKAGGYTSGQRTDDDNQTIRTEDFVDKFQDTMVYSSADEAEKLRNLDDDLHSDGGSDTDTLQRKLAVLTRTPVPAHLRNKKHNQGAAPGYPPIYPKPTPTASLPRPSTRSAIKISPGHGSDADSVRTEDFENSFKDMMVNPGNQTESDLDPGSHGNDPIHSKVKQLLKATAKYRINSDSSTSTTNSILKSRLRNSDRPKVDAKPKQHVRISPQPPQYNQAKGDDSDDTLCSDSEERVHSPRSEQTSVMKPAEREDETRREIARETDRIRRDMERERRAKSMSPARDRSPTRTYLSLTTPKSVYDKGDSPRLGYNGNLGGGDGGNDVTSHMMSPRSSSHASHTTSHMSFSGVSGGTQGDGGKSLSDEEKERSAELKATQNALDVTQGALLEARKDLKDIQAQYEDARTQLMLSEYKRETSTKELARLTEDLRRKKDMAKTLDTQASQRRDELKQFDAIGFTKDEAVQIIEENEKMKGRLRTLEAIHAERDELIQQLESTKHELFTEQKRARAQIEEVKEELENVNSTYEQTLTEKDEVTRKLEKLEHGYKKMEKEKNELIQEKTRQYEEERDKHRKDRSDWRKRSADEVETMRQDLIRMTNKCASLQDDLRTRDGVNQQLRAEMLELQQKTEQEQVSRSTIIEEHKKTLQTLRKETDSAMVQLRESLFLEKQKTMDQMREELDQERREIATRTEQRYENQVTELEAIIKAKTEELSHLNKLVSKLEADITRTRVRNDDDTKKQVQEAVNAARRTLTEERDWAVQQEREGLQREHRTQLHKLQEELTRMQNDQRGLESRMKEQRIEELEELKSNNKAQMHDKLVAVARAKELMRQEHTAELDRIKEQLKNEHRMELDKLRDTVRRQENEIRELREDRMKVVRQSKESNINLDRTERTLINEINEECRKTSEMLGLNPRQVNFSGSTAGSTSSGKPTTSALANLRACNEELRLHVTDIQCELELHRNTLNVAEREKDEALATLRRQMEREKEEEMTRLKERLVRVGQNGLSTNEYRSMMYSPDNDTPPRSHFEYKSAPTERCLRQVSDQQQQDLERLEREINKLAMTNGHGSPDDIDYAKQLNHLQSKVKQLQSENSSLRRGKLSSVNSTSSPDLSRSDLYVPNHRRFATRAPSPTMRCSSPTRDQQRLASAIEMRMKEHDIETETLTEHQRRNRDAMSRKMADMSKLQNTLTNQAKELIQLEKSYTQLNKYAKAPRPRSSLR